ncbi:MAG: hypothetical protein J0I52_06035 [Bordetella sp.]|nr:hypothetical protein [Bordetella sp.]
MKTTFSGAAGVALALAISGTAIAQTPSAAPHRPRTAEPVSQADFVQRRVERLRAADANGDGRVTAEEMRAHGQARRAERLSARFDRLDANKDGALSRAEFEAPQVRRDRMGGARADGASIMRGHRDHGRRAMGGRLAGQGAEARFPIVIAEVERKANEAFARLDANRDGLLSGEERRAALQAGRAETRQKRAPRRSVPASTSASPSAPASE